MDVLADVLNTMRLQSHVKFCMRLNAPWGIEMPSLNDTAVFYVVTRGSCYLIADRLESPVTLVGGDLVMLPHGDAHILRDQLEGPLVQFTELCAQYVGCRAFQHGGKGALTAMVAGRFIFESRASKSFFSALPLLIHIPGEHGQMVPWLDTTLKWMAAETNSNNPGAQIMTSRLADMLFIQILRAHIVESSREGQNNGMAAWLRALGDPYLGKAFEMIHEQPGHSWTVAELASKVNMSRTAFSVRFTQMAGVPPLTYVAKWRMLKASDLLRRREITISEIATRVGYESEASFRKAFKREMGVAPGAYRKVA